MNIEVGASEPAVKARLGVNAFSSEHDAVVVFHWQILSKPVGYFNRSASRIIKSIRSWKIATTRAGASARGRQNI